MDNISKIDNHLKKDVYLNCNRKLRRAAFSSTRETPFVAQGFFCGGDVTHVSRFKKSKAHREVFNNFKTLTLLVRLPAQHQTYNWPLKRKILKIVDFYFI